MSTEHVEMTLEGGVLTVVMNDPTRLNAMSWELLEGLVRAFERAEDPAVRVLVLAGRGRAFCSGGDMKAMSVDDEDQASAYVGLVTKVIAMLRDCPKPVVGAVQGYAVGGGAEIAFECDLLVLATDAVFRQPDVEIGSTPATVYRLVQMVGVATAARVVLGGQDLDASRARELGVVDTLVTPEEVLPTAQRIAERIAALSPKSTRYAKQALRLPATTDGSTDLQVNLAAELACYHSAEQRRAVAAFLDR